MMKWGWVFVGAFLVLGLLVACAEGEGVVVNTAVSTPLLTIEPTVTETAVPTKVSVGEETSLPTPAIPTETPTPPSPLAEVIDLKTLPEVPVDFSTAYSLKTPDYDLLHDWLRAARETLDKSSYFHIFDLLAFDFARSFPQGVGQLEPIYQENEYPGAYLAERLTWPILQTAVVAYLNQNQINLKDGSPINVIELTLNPNAVDWNSDGIEEWLVEVTSKELYIFGVIPLVVEKSGHYAILPNTIEPINTSNVSIYSNGVAQGEYDFDFTGDKVIDVLQAAQGYLGGPFGYINIYVWNDSGLYLLEKIDISVPSFKPYASFEVGDFTRDGVADVKVTTPHEVNFHCIWDEIDIYSWNGRTPHHLLAESKTPDTPYCALFHAITPRSYYSEALLAEKSRLELLEAALSQLSLETVPSADYLALAYVHLAAAYAAQWDDDLAQQTISRLVELPTQAPFVRLVNRIYEEEGKDEMDGVLKPVILRNICPDCEDALIYELRQDEQGDYIVGRLSSYQVTCLLSYELAVRNSPFLVRAIENDFKLVMRGTYCAGDADERPLAEISATDFDSTPTYFRSWYSVLHKATGKHYWEWLNELQTAVLSQTDLTTPEKITQLLNYLPSDDPDAQPYIEHLTYLLGYFYELSGDEETVVSTYLDLIQQYPTSPWSWLAWARLEPVRP